VGLSLVQAQRIEKTCKEGNKMLRHLLSFICHYMTDTGKFVQSLDTLVNFVEVDEIYSRAIVS
jgi:hypothetical protein